MGIEITEQQRGRTVRRHPTNGQARLELDRSLEPRTGGLYYWGVIIALVLWFAGMLLVASAQAEEVYVLGGHVQGTTAFGSDEAEPSSPVLVAGWASDRLGVWGDVRLEVEAQGMRHWQGVAVGLRWDLWDGWHVGAGTGVGALHADLDWQADGLNFLLQGEVGRRFWCRRACWRVDVRLHHISNARLRQPNTGTNGVLVLIGRSW